MAAGLLSGYPELLVLEPDLPCAQGNERVPLGCLEPGQRHRDGPGIAPFADHVGGRIVLAQPAVRIDRLADLHDGRLRAVHQAIDDALGDWHFNRPVFAAGRSTRSAGLPDPLRRRSILPERRAKTGAGGAKIGANWRVCMRSDPPFARGRARTGGGGPIGIALSIPAWGR